MKIGLISDIHEDIIMLQKAICEMEDMGVDEVICLGDIVGYSLPFYSFMAERDANAVVDLVRKTCSIVVMGNHDLYAIREIPENRSFFDYFDDWYERDFGERYKKAFDKLHLYENNELSSLLTAKNREFIKNLPEYMIKDFGNFSLLFSHYAIPDCTGSSTWKPKKSVELKAHFNFMSNHNCIYSFSGNDHIEGMQIFTKEKMVETTFESFDLPSEKIWMHGPAIARGTTYSGFTLFDTDSKELTAVPLTSERHTVPEYI